MLNIISLLTLLFVNILTKISSLHYEFLTATIMAVVCFTVFEKLFYYVINNTIEPTQKTLYFSIIYLIVLVCAYSLIIYLITPEIFILRILVFLIMIVIIFFIKYKDFNNKICYGKKYIVLNIFDTIIITTLQIINLFINPNILQKSLIIETIMFLIIIDVLINLYIEYRKEIWLHRNALITLFDINISNKTLDKFFEKAKDESVSDNYFLTECNYLMSKSFIRYYGINYITKMFIRRCYANHMHMDTALSYTGDLCSILVSKLMRREMDFMIIPTIVINPIQYMIRYHKFKNFKK